MSRLRQWITADPSWLPVACLAVPLLMWSILARDYAQTFNREVTAWLVAAERAPMKPRPHLNLALSLIEKRRFREAWIVLDHVGTLVDDPKLEPWERDEAASALLSHRLLLSRLDHRGMP